MDTMDLQRANAFATPPPPPADSRRPSGRPQPPAAWAVRERSEFSELPSSLRGGEPSDSPGRRPGLVAPALRLQKPAVRARKKKESVPTGRKAISVLLIEDNRLFRTGLAGLIKNQAGLQLVASLEQPDHVPKLGEASRPDVILVDMGLGGRGILEVVRGIRATYSQAKVIVMGLIPAQSEVLGLVKAGVSGYVLKDASVNDFVGSIRAVAAGKSVFPSSLAESLFSQIIEDANRKHLVDIADVRMTPRERDIARLIALGMSNKEIAQRLNIAIDTVKSHVHNILEKLSLRSRVEVAVRTRGWTSADR
jgi:DNA-binding NarL/FixJ family response regulator